MSLNIIILAPKLANIWNSDPILEHFLHLGQKCITIESRNLKYDMTRTFPPRKVHTEFKKIIFFKKMLFVTLYDLSALK